MADVTITVMLKDGTTNPPKIKLKDSEGHDPGNDDLTTNVSAGNSIEWVPDTASGIASVVGIVKKADSNYDLIEPSSGAPNGTSYTANIVSTSPGKDKKEKYNIQFTVTGNNTIYTEDPKLKMKD